MIGFYYNDSFYHYPNPKKVIEEIGRILKYRGMFKTLVICQIMSLFIRYNRGGVLKFILKKK